MGVTESHGYTHFCIEPFFFKVLSYLTNVSCNIKTKNAHTTNYSKI